MNGMIKIRSSYIPLKRKTNVYQWQFYIKSKLRELRGYEKHKGNDS